MPCRPPTPLRSIASTRALSLTCAALFIVALFASGCSFSTFDRTRCASDDECVGLYGAGATCGAEGYCSMGSGDADPQEALAPNCLGDDVPEILSSSEFLEVSTVDLGNEIDDVACLKNRAEGDDGFFRVAMNAGEKWHFHVRKMDPASDPVVYVLPACDARACAPGSATDICGPDTDEHLSFVAPTAGTYLVGVDSRTPGGFPFQLLATRPTCGNGGMPEHSEGCDDGDTVDGDGCDSRCRSEIGENVPMEDEPNDEFTSANVLRLALGAEALGISGQLGSACDTDMFAFTLAEAASLIVEWRDSAGMPCASELAGSKLEILAADGLTTLHSASASPTQACPSFGADKAVALSAGSYHIRVTAPGNRANYKLAISLTAS